METLTPEEQIAHTKMMTASQEFQTEMVNKLQMAKGVNIIGLVVSGTMTSLTLEALVNMMFEAEPSLKIKFWERMTKEIDKMMAEMRTSVILTPENVRNN